MAKKKKKIVWHKKSGKFISSKYLKKQEKAEPAAKNPSAPRTKSEKIKEYRFKLSQEIKKAL